MGKCRNPIEHIDDQLEAIDVVAHRHVKRRGRGAFFLIAAHMKVMVIARR